MIIGDVTEFGSAWRAFFALGEDPWTRIGGPLAIPPIDQGEQEPRILTNEQQAIEQRAHELLLSMLTPEQQEDVRQHGYFTVVGADGASYHLDVYGGAFNVARLDADGKKLSTHCLDVGEGLPPGDQVLVQKLLIEADEQKFLEMANMHRREHLYHSIDYSGLETIGEHPARRFCEG